MVVPPAPSYRWPCGPGNTSISMGCIGFRVYTGIPDEEMMLAVPGRKFQVLVDRLDTMISANSALEDFHAQL